MQHPANLHSAGRPRDSAAVRRHQRPTALSLAMACMIVLLFVQLWLLVGAIEGVLGGEGAIAFPATLISGVCCLGTWWLWSLLRRRER